MKVQLAHILQSLYRTTELDDVPVHRLQETLREHPYFSAVQFLLAQKLKAQRSEQYEEQVQRTAVYFYDPLWMHWQLNHGAEMPVETIFAVQHEKEEEPVSEAVLTAGFEHVAPEPVQPSSFVENLDEFPSTQTDTHVAERDTVYSDSYPEGSEEPASQSGESGTNEWSSPAEPIHENGVEHIEQVETDRPSSVDELSSHENEPSFESEPSVENEPLVDNEPSLENEPSFETGPSFETESSPEIKASPESEPSFENEHSFKNESSIENEHSIETESSSDAEPSFESAQPSVDAIEPSSDIIRTESEERPVEEITPVIQMTEAAETSQEVTAPMIQMTENAAEAPRDEKPSTPTAEKQPVAFDPYYTIDYFAYQGIKAPTDIQPGDKLGKQLKSFTEWLKTMRRLPQVPMEQQIQQPDEAVQQDIRRFAADSLKDKEVLTETMAEVLVKQDRKEEAIGIYEKLSLLDPSKSAYFAAKIENLKSELI